jgi:calcium/calmodulin-dependent protein kinase I
MERGKFTERDAVDVIKTVLCAVKYLHEHHVVHRGKLIIACNYFFFFFLSYLIIHLNVDLKPENLIYRDETDDSELVLADFG